MAIDGEPVPGTFAAEDELFGIGRVLGELGTGVFELAPAGALGEDLAAPEREMAWMRKLSAAIKRPVTFALTQNDHDPESWRLMLDLCARGRGARAARFGRRSRAGRSACCSGCRRSTRSRTARRGRRSAARRPPRRSRRWAIPSLRAKLLVEVDAAIASMRQFLDPERAFPMGPTPDYEPAAQLERRRAARRPRASR